jgi:sodium-dependent dicarboxylate transporter 2/3/5
MNAAMIRRAGLVAGPVLALVCYLALPTEFADGTGKIVPFLHPGRATLAMLVWMALWWMTEAVDIEVTALLPLVAFPLAGIMSIEEAAAPYSSSVVYLFLGGFVLALAIQRADRPAHRVSHAAEVGNAGALPGCSRPARS